MATRFGSGRRRSSSVPDAGFARYCSRCGQPVVVPGALYCKECGATLQSGQLVQARDYNPATAALLSIIPGLGHLYRGRVGRGVLWFFVVALAYGMGPIGYLIHFACAANAAFSGAIERGGSLRARRRLRRMRRYDAP
jgi:hypothetical protein